MSKDCQSKKWLITINNPDDHGITEEMIHEILQQMPLRYACMSKEIASTGTPHYHIFVLAKSAMRFSTIKHKLPEAHIDKAKGTAQDNRDYIRKDGKWADTDKAETRVPGSFWEFGSLPSPAEEKSPDKAALIDLILSGRSDFEIVNVYPNFSFRLKDMALLRQTLLSDKYRELCRDVTVTYLYGPNAEVMTNYVYAQHDPRDICRITNYRHSKSISYDSYTAEDVLLLERFRGDIPLRDLLALCSGYPTTLPARYTDRMACYTMLYITSDLGPDLQYPCGDYSVPRMNEFLGRIDRIIEFLADGSVVVHRDREASNDPH